ncbi:MAG TPA: carboxypeptidase regulatory-like domain-containing protein, partial [Tepidisphaeraceae bacterium]
MNLLRSVLESSAVERVGWTLVHFVWEGALVALLLAGLLALLRRRSSSTRYVSACAALLVLAALPVVTFVLTPAREVAEVAPGPLLTPPSPKAHTPARAQPIPLPATPPRSSTTLVELSGSRVVTGPDAGRGIEALPASASHAAKPQAWSQTLRASFADWSRRSIDVAAPALPWVVTGWCAGVLALATWNLGGWAAVRRLRRRATGSVGESIANSAARLAGQMGLRRAVRVLQSTLVDSPLVIGAIKPVILLPASLLTGLSPAQVESLLAHELAHVRRHDYLINLLQGVIETLLFYHPAIWWVSRRIRVEREHCCDDAVIALTADRASYVRALAVVAESAATHRASSLTGRLVPAASGGSLLARVRRLLGLPDADTARSPRWLAGAVALVLCLVAATAVVTHGQDKPAAANPDARKDKDFDLPEDKTLDLEVVDKASGEPMPTLTLSVRTDNQTRAFATDAQGHAKIDFAPGSRYMSITAKPVGYVPTQLTWRNDNTKDPVPDKFTLEVEHGTTIGGIIHDEEGKPVEGVTVQLILRRKNESSNACVTTAIWDFPCRTDEQGHWTCDIAPKDLEAPMIRLSHPDYISDEMYNMTPAPPIDKLRDMTGVMVLKKGVAVAGRVLDDQGKPIARAKVMQGRDRFGSHYPETTTNAQGNFRFPQVRGGTDMVLTVTAKGRSPDQKTLRVDAPVENIEFRLAPGHVVHGRVVDPDGKPLAGVMIATDTWRGNRALMFRANTDGQGRWTWNEAPADEVLTDILKQGFMDVRQRSISPSDQEQTFKLTRPMHVAGTVLDAQTGKPVDSFRVLRGTDWGQGQAIYWDRREGRVQSGGKFEFDITYPYPGYAVRIEANGYLPADSRTFHDADAPVTLEFKLKKGQSLTGVVRTPDGKPLAGADVILCPGPNSAYIRNGEIQQRQDSPAVQTDGAGRYALPPQTGQYAVIILHDRGYAMLRSEQLAKSTGDITLQPWGRVTGVLRVGAKPAPPGTMLSVQMREEEPYDPKTPRAYHDIQTATDTDGRFTFPKVPPGRASVAVQVKLSENMTGFTQSTPVTVKAGETVEVNIGGTGRPIVGRIKAPAELKDVNWSASQSGFMTKIYAPQPRFPDNWNEMEQADRQKWIDAWNKSADGKAQREAVEKRRYYTLRVNQDGSFRADDVPAGEYQANIVLTTASGNNT